MNQHTATRDLSAPQQIVIGARGQTRGGSCYICIREGMTCLMEMPMRLRPVNSPLSPAQSAALDCFLTELGMGFNLAHDRRAREAALARLDALPDGALRSMGLNRATLPAHVYSDLIPKGSA